MKDHYSYIICHPHLLNENQVQFVLQEAGLGLFHAYSDPDFACKLLQAIEIEADIEQFEIKPYRCYYYSHYQSSKYPWYDRWYAFWKVIISTLQPIVLKTFMEEIPLEAFGSEIINHPNESDSTGCLVIADFESEENRDYAEEKIVKHFFSQNLATRQLNIVPAITHNETYTFAKKKKFYQLIIDLGFCKAKFFENGAQDANIAIDICQMYKGKTHHYHLLD
jgi:hypothetical protein